MDIVDAVTSVEEEYYEDGDEEMPLIKLKDGICLQEVVNGSAVFELNTDCIEKEDHQLSYFNKEELLRCSNFECLDEDENSDGDEKIEPGKSPFERIALKMVSISEDGKVKKKEITPGFGSVVPEGACVTIHYNSYVEYGDEPYDSTWLRGRSVTFRLQRNNVIPGLDIAIATMKKEEHSRFLIHPDLGFGKFGCPPRIPENATLLFDVHLMNFQDNAAAEAFEALSMDEREKQDFSIILKAAKAERWTGNDLFKKNQIKQAIIRYKKAINFLERSRLKDEAEEKQQQRQLLRLYVNLGVCYNKQKLPRLACNACKEALAIDPRNAKALFNFGRALLILSCYREAKNRLLQAQKLEPDNLDITEELKKLDIKQKKYDTEVKSFSKRAFGSSDSSTKQPKSKAEVTEKFQQEVIMLITEFVNDSERNQMILPSHLTAQEELCIRQEAEEKTLTVRSYEQKGETVLLLSKPENW